MLFLRLPINSRLTVLKFWGVKSYTWVFDYMGVGTLHPHVVQVFESLMPRRQMSLEPCGDFLWSRVNTCVSYLKNSLASRPIRWWKDQKEDFPSAPAHLTLSSSGQKSSSDFQQQSSRPRAQEPWKQGKEGSCCHKDLGSRGYLLIKPINVLKSQGQSCIMKNCPSQHASYVLLRNLDIMCGLSLLYRFSPLTYQEMLKMPVVGLT